MRKKKRGRGIKGHRAFGSSGVDILILGCFSCDNSDAYEKNGINSTTKTLWDGTVRSERSNKERQKDERQPLSLS